MLSKGIRKYIYNPAIGLLPFLLFLILYTTPLQRELVFSIPLIFSIVSEIIIYKVSRNRVLGITFFVSSISLIITFICWIFTHKWINNANTYLILYEVLIATLFIGIRLSKTLISTRIIRKTNSQQKAFLNLFYQIATLIQYVLTIHIFIILIYKCFKVEGETYYESNIFIFTILPILLILGLIAYEMINIKKLSAKLRKEDWIPIVSEKGEVTGKIAKSISFNMKNKFLHPVVRVALISNDKVYLQERPSNDILSPEKLDYPFEKYLLYNHEINLAARNSIYQMMEKDIDLSISFVLKYVFENDNTKRLIFLFVARIGDDNLIKRSERMKGKFWTIKQIEDGFVDEVFSECFELEFEYLKNMVLMPLEQQN